MSEPSQEKQPRFLTQTKVNQSNIFCETKINRKGYQIAYYLVVDNNVKHKRWYSDEYQAEFEIVEERHKSHQIITFIKHKDGVFSLNPITSQNMKLISIRHVLRNNLIIARFALRTMMLILLII